MPKKDVDRQKLVKDRDKVEEAINKILSDSSSEYCEKGEMLKLEVRHEQIQLSISRLLSRYSYVTSRTDNYRW